MRLSTSVALAFLFFINVLATPINPSRGTAVTFTRRGPSNSKAPTTAKKLLDSLSTVDKQHPLGETEWCCVYNMKVDNQKVILKVVDSEIKKAKREAWALHNVGQLIRWGHTTNKEVYYLFIKYMGIPLQLVPFKNDHERVRTLQRNAEKTYLSDYHLTHCDHEEPNDDKDPNKRPGNWAFREVDGVWRAELIDWEYYYKERGYKGFKRLPEPFVIDPDRYFVPEMKKYLISTR